MDWIDTLEAALTLSIATGVITEPYKVLTWRSNFTSVGSIEIQRVILF